MVNARVEVAHNRDTLPENKVVIVAHTSTQSAPSAVLVEDSAESDGRVSRGYTGATLCPVKIFHSAAFFGDPVRSGIGEALLSVLHVVLVRLLRVVVLPAFSAQLLAVAFPELCVLLSEILSVIRSVPFLVCHPSLWPGACFAGAFIPALF